MENSHSSDLGQEEKELAERGVHINAERDDDSSKLASPRLDLTQKLDRFITFIPAFAFVSNLQASWESVSASFQAGLINGGPTSLVYGQLLAWIGSLAIALSLAEMASINPTVGAQYRWTGLYAPPEVFSPAFWGLLQGWITVFAWIATAASPAFLIGTTIQGLMVFFDTNYVFERWHGSLLAIAVLSIPLFFNVFARRTLSAIEYIGAFTHIGFFIIWIAVLTSLAPKSSTSFVFTETITGLSGWSSTAIQWNIGLLSAVFPLSGFDGILHMSDEVKDAPRKVPQSMVLSVLINGFMSFTMMITILYTLGDAETALTAPTNGYPIIYVIYAATKSRVATGFMLAMTMWNGLVAFFGALASVSRLTWAFARDGGIPFSTFFGAVQVRLRIPLNSLILISFIIAALQLINIGSTTALYAILSVSTIALYMSYMLPILFVLIHKLRSKRIYYGPFKLGAFGIPLNIFSLLYGIYILVWLPFPPFLPVTGTNMNYGGPVMGAVILFALIDWFIWGRKRFGVPVEIEHVEY